MAISRHRAAFCTKPASRYATKQQTATVHFYPLEGVSDTIQFYSRESGMSGYAPHLSVEPKNWNPQAFVLVVR